MNYDENFFPRIKINDYSMLISSDNSYIFFLWKFWICSFRKYILLSSQKS